MIIFLDLDEKIAKEGLDKVLREDVLKQNDSNKNSSSMHEFKNQQQPSIFSSFGQSYSVRRIQRPDGVCLYLFFYVYNIYLIKKQLKQ